MIYAPVKQDLPTDVGGLLDTWLNIQAGEGCDFIVSPPSMTVPIPAFDGEANRVGVRQLHL
jgi:hypothetical protein